MEQENKSFYKFGKTFQEDLCHLVLNDRSFADQMFEVLDLNFLELKFTRQNFMLWLIFDPWQPKKGPKNAKIGPNSLKNKLFSNFLYGLSHIKNPFLQWFLSWNYSYFLVL